MRPLPMRLLQVMAGARQGGAETYFVNLALAFQAAGIEQRAVIRRHYERAGQLQAGGVQVDQFGFGGRLDILTPLRLRLLARDYKPDIVLTWMNRASTMMPRGPYPIVARLGGYYDLKNYAKADWLVANTPDIARHCITAGFRADRVRMIANYGRFEVAPKVPRASLDTPETAPLLLAMGRLHVNKAFDVLLRALVLLPGAYLWLAGEGPERAALQQLAQDLGVAHRVRFLGWRNDREALAAACDVYVVPSRHEPFGNVILDAWGAGKPLVCTASQGPRDFVQADITGLMVPVDDENALAAAIHAVLHDEALAARLGAAGKARFKAAHDEAAIVAQWQDLFIEVRAACAA
ncbi:glycosyltransferase [Ferrovibrio sp.]|uniref:glycosyltransferase n=1 Tax=Ferrovibrio sp. TaxID=1917215 RepID=UPI0025BADAE1|nr:glycosyltransferase [Ferrovibrio sp.]